MKLFCTFANHYNVLLLFTIPMISVMNENKQNFQTCRHCVKRPRQYDSGFPTLQIERQILQLHKCGYMQACYANKTHVS